MEVCLKINYQPRDREIIDYGMVELPDTGMLVRGPLPDLSPGSYFSTIGAAQTIGCYCENPYPTLLSRALGFPVLNLGYPGAGAEFFLSQPRVIEKINRGRFAVLQVTSGRSQSNAYYECGGLARVRLHRDGRIMVSRTAFQELIDPPPFVQRLPAPDRVKRKLGSLMSGSAVRAVVDDIRAEWVKSNLELIERIEVPVVLLWYSKRGQDYRVRTATVNTIWGEFPQLVNAEMIAQLRPKADAFVECVTARGSPQKLFSRFTGERIERNGGLNRYYPSPEMHADAAAALEDVCRGYL